MTDILIADNSREFAEMLREYLGKQDDMCVVGIAQDGWAAYNMIGEYHPDVLILDIIMPHLDGMGVLGKLREMEPEKRPLVIILSAIGQHEKIIQDVMDLGADYYMIKPLNMDVLVSRIRQMVNDRYPESERM